LKAVDHWPLVESVNNGIIHCYTKDTGPAETRPILEDREDGLAGPNPACEPTKNKTPVDGGKYM